MDHRCLYGHRVSESFEFAIQNRVCPTCGAPSVSLDGYQLARQFSEEMSLDGVDAFKVVLHLERNYRLLPLNEGEAEASEGDDDPELAEGTQAPTPESPSSSWDEVAVNADEAYEPEVTEAFRPVVETTTGGIGVTDPLEAAFVDEDANLETVLMESPDYTVQADADVVDSDLNDLYADTASAKAEEPTEVVPPPRLADEIAPTLISAPRNLATVTEPVDSDAERSFFDS